MKLKDIIENLDNVKRIEGKTSLDINGLSHDSKTVRQGYLFVAIKGSRFNGVDFIDEAIDRGGLAIILESPDKEGHTFKRGVSFIYVDDARDALSKASRAFYGDCSNKMYLVGVTGTNGKTTTTYLVESLFKVKSEKTGIIGTINYRFGKRLIPSLNTTPGPLELYSLLSSMNKDGIKNCILEISSHSLEQGRVDTLNFDIAVFTNLSKEHLDYHKSMDNYLASKKKLFAKIKKGGHAVINIDDAYSKGIIEELRLENKAGIITYGIEKDADLRAEDISFSSKGLNFTIRLKNDEAWHRQGRTSGQGSGSTLEIESSLIGQHNVYNILASSACGIAMGMGLEDIQKGIKQLRFLPGRLERIDCGQDFSVFVDYAHTGNGLENVLKTLRGLRPKRLLTVFGCGGDRDKAKRPDMGRISSELSDKIFITSDNPRNEEPLDIIEQITEGIDKTKDNFVIETDRFKAIKRALKEAQKGDIVLVAGKGHEAYQIFKNITLPFDDREAVRRVLCLQSKTS